MAIFIGGDCDGETVVRPNLSPVICGTTEYRRGADGNFYSPGATAGGPIGPEALGIHGPQGWADLRRTIGTTVPTYTRKTQILARATKHRLARRRRHS